MTGCPFHFDPFEPATLANPYPAYAQARKEAPVVYHEGLGVWFVTRYADIMTILCDPTRFSSKKLFRIFHNPPPAVLAAQAQGIPEAYFMVGQDPPYHARARSRMSKAFLPNRVKPMEPRIRAIAHGLIDTFINTGQVDLSSAFTGPLPVHVLLEFIGLPVTDAPFIKTWSDAFMRHQTPGLSPAEQMQIVQTELTFMHYIQDIIAERQRTPQEDLLSLMIHDASQGEDALNESELFTMVEHLLAAGQETAVALLNNALLHLLTEPHAWDALRENPDLAGNVIEETMRMDSPTRGMFRLTTAEVEVGGVTIPANARLFLLFGSANRDETVFTDPDRFDMLRQDKAPHLGLGYGIHYCVGAPLARLEARIALETLVQRLPTLRLLSAEPLTYLPLFLFHFPAQLPVAWSVGA